MMAQLRLDHQTLLAILLGNMRLTDVPEGAVLIAVTTALDHSILLTLEHPVWRTNNAVPAMGVAAV